MNDLLVHNHAIERLQERFGVDESCLINKLEEGKFVWLKGSSGSSNRGDVKNVRYGHLIYLPHRNDYCIVVMDYRSRLVITVLTEEMALNSSWGKGLDQAAKLKAKRIALGKEAVDDIHFLYLYAEERDGLSVKVRARAVSNDWELKVLTLSKITITPEQIDINKKNITLTNEQMNEISKLINEKIESTEIRPFCELFVSSCRGKTAVLSNSLDSVSDLESAERARRWRNA